MELRDKTIIITGASSGIGAAAAFLFAAEGASVVLGARREEELERIAGQINQSNGHAVTLAGDVCDPVYHQALCDLAQERFGGLDCAFNNAGMVGEMSRAEDMAEANWQSVLTTNLTSGFYAARAQIPLMRKSGTGAMVFTSSFVGTDNGGMPGMGAYAAAKSGLNGFVQSLASDHAEEGIRVNAILPGGTKTPMAGDDAQVHEVIAGLHPVKRMAAPGEIAQAAMFLLSERAGFITGARFNVDGGMAVRLL